MTLNANRPVIISILQYQDEIESGTLSVSDLIDKVVLLGVDGIELRREPWKHYQAEVKTVRDQLETQGKFATYATFSTLFAPDADAQALLLHDIDTAQTLDSQLLPHFPGAAPTTFPIQHGVSRARQSNMRHRRRRACVRELRQNHPAGTPYGNRAHPEGHSHPALQTKSTSATTPPTAKMSSRPSAPSATARLRHLKDKLGSTSDATTYLGGGAMPMPEIMTALDALPQRVIYCFEFTGGGEPDERITKSLAYLQAR